MCFWCRSRPPTRRSTSSPRLRRRTNALRPRISVGNDDRLQADRVIGPYALDRRLILIGSYIDSVSQADPVSMARLMKGLDEFLERDQDRALFNLPPPPQRRLPPVLGAFLERFRTDGDGPGMAPSALRASCSYPGCCGRRRDCAKGGRFVALNPLIPALGAFNLRSVDFVSQVPLLSA